MSKVKFLIVYKTGPKFNPSSIHLLRRQVEHYDRNGEFEFLCITDHPDLLRDYPEWTLELERKNVEGWWCLPEKFRVEGPVMFTGIDTVICGDLAPFAKLARECPRPEEEKLVYMIHPMRFPNRHNRVFANGIMVWNGLHKWFYNGYEYQVAATKYPLEQDYTAARLIQNGYNIKVLQHAVDGIYSWKANLNRTMDAPPEDTRVLLFHGKEKPHLFNEGWIAQHVKRFSNGHD
jgi:hypothetical protein